MAKKTTKKLKKQETPAQRLSGIIKNCRNIMRKDKGLNGDADRLPMLTWLMFLKFMDDKEQEEETKALLNNQAYQPVIASPYRWRDWATNDHLSGDDLLAFINNENAPLPDNTQGTGLLYYLRRLQSESGKARQDVLATVFKGLNNRMINGFLLRDVVNKINEIHFTSNAEVNTLSLLYESILKEMRDAAGDAGEFYTPRPMVKFMVDMIDPQLGETVLDPAAGTGGFLVTAFDHLKQQAQSTDQWHTLQHASIQGGEAKPLPYLLCQMNLLLHGLEYPDIDPLNSLRRPLRDIGDDQRVDIVLTNPPFGGEEEKGILNNFPADKQTAETTWLFIQLIMRKLRLHTPEQRGGRAAVVVPNGTLFADGVAARIKETLLAEFHLHTIVRLGDGVFAPYTEIPCNILFFEQGSPTQDIWYYEMPTPEGQKKYSKTKPLQHPEFDTLRQWWQHREANDHAWQVNFAEVLQAKKDEAAPHWQKAEEAQEAQQKAKAQMARCEAKAKETDPAEAGTLKAKAKKLKAEANDWGNQAREHQRTGDAIVAQAYNLDIKNPHRKGEYEYQDPATLMQNIVAKEQDILQLMQGLEALVAGKEEKV